VLFPLPSQTDSKTNWSHSIRSKLQQVFLADVRMKLGLQGMLISMTLVGVSAMIAGLLFTGILVGAPATANHRLNLLPFILATAMAPLGVPALIYWGLRIARSSSWLRGEN
jgi:hypothetical protein